MKFEEQWMHDAEESELGEALRNFKASVHAWSDAEYNRPRALAAQPARRLNWRIIAISTTACMLVAGTVSGGLYQKQQQYERQLAQVKIATQQAAQQAALQAEQQKQQAAQQVWESDDLLAAVDKDVSREVPSAMEPLAQLTSVDMAE